VPFRPKLKISRSYEGRFKVLNNGEDLTDNNEEEENEFELL